MKSRALEMACVFHLSELPILARTRLRHLMMRIFMLEQHFSDSAMPQSYPVRVVDLCQQLTMKILIIK